MNMLGNGEGRGRLTRRTVTAGSQIILPAYPGLAVMLGLLFILQNPRRTEGAAFDMAKEVMSITQWGIVFLGLGVFKVAAFVARNSDWLRYCLIVGCGLSGFWAVLLLLSAYQNIEASYTSGLWIAFVCLAHAASARSLARDVVWHAPRG